MTEMDEELETQGRALEDMGKILRSTLMDDYYMRRFFSENIPCVQYVLRVIMDDPTLVVKSATTQTMKKGPKHEVILDIDAVDGNDEEYDIEVERSIERANPKRARFNSAIMDTNQLEKGLPYQALRRTVVIFITEDDVLGDSLPLYRIERTINGKRPFNDGTLIIYVNNAIQDTSTELGRLMHDFSCVSADSMYSPLLADRTRFFKNTEEGRAIMSSVWEDMKQSVWKEAQDEAAKREKEATVQRMLNMGKWSFQDIADAVDWKPLDVQAVARGLGLAPAI